MQSYPEIQEAATRVAPAAHPGRVAADGRERRVFDRLRLDVTVDYESDHNFYTGFTENISTGGLFIATRDILPIGSRFPVTFTLSNLAAQVVAECEVRWQRLEQLDDRESVPGMGVRFVGLDPASQSAINAFIRQRDSLFYDDEP